MRNKKNLFSAYISYILYRKVKLFYMCCIVYYNCVNYLYKREIIKEKQYLDYNGYLI